MSSFGDLGGVFTPRGTRLALRRLGYGAIHLAGPQAFGPPANRGNLVSVVREAVNLGVNHLDTADFYGPDVANEILREALQPHPDDLVIATKVGIRRGTDKSWQPALAEDDLVAAVHSNLRTLGVRRLDLVYLRVGGPFNPTPGSIESPLKVLAALRREGLIGHIGLSNVLPEQVVEGQAVTPIAAVQNRYNLAFRQDDALIEVLAGQGIAYVPFFPLGGFQPVQSPRLDEAARALGATTRQVSLAWLLQRSPNILVVAGTTSSQHLRDNLGASRLALPPDLVQSLNEIAAPS